MPDSSFTLVTVIKDVVTVYCRINKTFPYLVKLVIFRTRWDKANIFGVVCSGEYTWYSMVETVLSVTL